MEEAKNDENCILQQTKRKKKKRKTTQRKERETRDPRVKEYELARGAREAAMDATHVPFRLQIGVDVNRYPCIQIDALTQTFALTNTYTVIGSGE